MVTPDSRCEIHGTPKRIWKSKDGTRKHVYCLECRYAREDSLRELRGQPIRRRNFGTTCRRGHPRTPSNWRLNKARMQYYCYRCHVERESANATYRGVLVKGNTRVYDRTLIRALREIGRTIACAVCGNTGEWRGQPMELDIHFIDGDYTNAEAANLRIMCPNCRSQVVQRKRVRQEDAA